jgi:hypothetical protein
MEEEGHSAVDQGDLAKWHLVPVATGKCCGCFASTPFFASNAQAKHTNGIL